MSDTHESKVDIYHQVLSCRSDPKCKAVSETPIGNVEAVCSATPGLIQTAGMYIVLRETHIPDPDLHYPFDEVVKGEIVGFTPGVITGDIQLVAGKVSNAVYTDGIHDQYVNLGNLRQYCVGDLRLCQHGLTISLWLRPQVRKSGELHYFTNGGHTSRSMGVFLGQWNKGLSVSFRNDIGSWEIRRVFFQALDWYFITLVWGPTSGARLYLNGCLAGEALTLTSSAGRSNGPYNDFILGASNVAGDRHFSRVAMTMDELKIWDARMGEEQVWNLYVSHL